MGAKRLSLQDYVAVVSRRGLILSNIHSSQSIFAASDFQDKSMETQELGYSFDVTLCLFKRPFHTLSKVLHPDACGIPNFQSLQTPTHDFAPLPLAKVTSLSLSATVDRSILL